MVTILAGKNLLFFPFFNPNLPILVSQRLAAVE